MGRFGNVVNFLFGTVVSRRIYFHGVRVSTEVDLLSVALLLICFTDDDRLWRYVHLPKSIALLCIAAEPHRRFRSALEQWQSLLCLLDSSCSAIFDHLDL